MSSEEFLRTWVDIALEDRAKAGTDNAKQTDPPVDTDLTTPPLEAQQLNVDIVLADGSVFASISTRLDATVRELCFSVIEQKGPCGRLRMHYEGNKLNEESSLLDLGIRADCRLSLEVCQAVATSSEDCTARVWNATTGECDLVLRGHEKPVCSIAFAPDFRSLLTGSEDETAKIWAMDTGDCVMTLSGHCDTVFGGRFSMDCTSVATASADGTARVWTAKTGKCRFVLEGHQCPLYSVVWEKSDEALVTSATDNTMKMWISKTGKCIRTFSGTTQQYSSSFNAEGSAYVTAAGDNTATICGEDGTLIQTLAGHKGLVMCACFATPPRKER